MNRFYPLLIGALAFTACDSAEPDDIGPGEEELITEVTLTLTNTDDASDTVTIVASDEDGDGAGIVFTPARASLRAGATYDGAITLRDGINDEDITEEIEEEAEEHLFRYAFQPSSAGFIELADNESDYTDEDDNGGDLRVGLAFSATVDGAAAGDGELNAILYHFDDGAVKETSLDTSDEIDIDIEFPVAFEQPAL